MKPVSPVIKGYEQFEINVGEGQPEYIPLPTVVAEGPEKRFFSRWEFTEDERRLISEGGSLILQQLTFGNPFQPVAFEVVAKEEIDPTTQVKVRDVSDEEFIQTVDKIATELGYVKEG